VEEKQTHYRNYRIGETISSDDGKIIGTSLSWNIAILYLGVMVFHYYLRLQFSLG
jgi:hypothetical protein